MDDVGVTGKSREEAGIRTREADEILLHANMKIKKWIYSGDKVGKIDMGDLNGKLGLEESMEACWVSRRRCFSVCCQNQSLSYEEEVSGRARYQ